MMSKKWKQNCVKKDLKCDLNWKKEVCNENDFRKF